MPIIIRAFVISVITRKTGAENRVYALIIIFMQEACVKNAIFENIKPQIESLPDMVNLWELNQ